MNGDTTESVKLIRRPVFDFDAAVKEQYARTKSGDIYTIIAHDQKHFVALCHRNWTEHRFDHTGRQIDALNSGAMLYYPCKTKVTIPSFIAYDSDRMEIICFGESSADVSIEGTEILKASPEMQSIQVINTSRDENKEALRTLGYESHFWYE